MSDARTSDTHPIEVGWLPTAWLGRVGLTFAPGKKQSAAATGAWDRDLGKDIRRLREDFGADHLICLLEEHEFHELGIADLPKITLDAGMEFHRFPIRDSAIPAEEALQGLVSQIVGAAATGETLVIHCKGGLGRAGTVGGAILRAAGCSPEEAFAALSAARGSSCPETEQQRELIARFGPGGPSRRSRVLGAVMAAAIGDALGHPTEFLRVAEIKRRFGPAGVTGFEEWWEQDGRRFAPYTDDTQMAEIVLRALVRSSGPEEAMQEMAAGFAAWAVAPLGGHRAPGNACMAGAHALSTGVPWREAGGATAGGCGSVMRAYPFGLLLAHDLELAELWAVEHSHMTHRDPIALAACAAMAAGVALELHGEQPDRVLSAMIEAAGRHDRTTAGMCETALSEARSGADPEEVLTRLQGWAAHQAIAAAMFVVSRHERDLRGALLEGANADGDSDSIATLAGALLGARLGLEAVPAEWVRDVERSDELLALAKEAAAIVEG